MKRETYESQRIFAGDKFPQMTRRMLDHDYTGRQIYMVTMTVEGRRPLFGRVIGKSDSEPGSQDAPCCELTELGQAVSEEFMLTEIYHPEIKVIALQMMPDHLHGILFVKQKMQQPLGMVIRGFKQSCNKHYRRLVLGVQSVALTTQQTGHETQQTGQETQTGRETQQTGQAMLQERPYVRSEHYDRHHGLLFTPNYCDKLLIRSGQLDTWLHYLKDNPRRLLMKREHPDLFRVRRNVELAGIVFSAQGNLFLAHRPVLLQVQCSRRMTATEIENYKSRMLAAARQGAVLVSPSISPGEKITMRAAFDEGLPLIYLQENGLTDLAKPGGRRFDACASGQLLVLSPWGHHNEHNTISRLQCQTLNDYARRLCESEYTFTPS